MPKKNTSYSEAEQAKKKIMKLLRKQNFNGVSVGLTFKSEENWGWIVTVDSPIFINEHFRNQIENYSEGVFVQFENTGIAMAY